MRIRREVTLTLGPIVVRGHLSSRNRKKKKFADDVLYRKSGIPVAVVEAKDRRHTVGHGLQQALGYAEILNVPSAFSCNGEGFAAHNFAMAYFHGKGMAVNALYLKDIRLSPLAVPPISEQHRIVAKVDELMALCDRLKTRLKETESTQQQMADTMNVGIASIKRWETGGLQSRSMDHAL